MPPDHDRLFKTLFRTFFSGFLRLVVPAIAERLDMARATFLDKELLAEQPAGNREADLLARVPVHGDGTLLIHVEIEARARSRMPHRLRAYASRIQALYGEQVLSILVNLRGGKPGIHQAALDDGLSAPELSSFRYVVFGLSGCQGPGYLALDEPVAWALAAVMKTGGVSRPAYKLACQTRIAAAKLPDGQRIRLMDFVEAYLELTPGEAKEYKKLDAGNRGEATAMWMTWSEKLKAEGWKEGVKLGKREGVKVGKKLGKLEGRRTGKLEGRQEGVRSLQEVLLFQLAQRFGPLPESIHRQVEAIDSPRRLTNLMKRVLTAGSLRELRLR
jgi:hypothetical protein